jgi:hypothetical protein
VENGCERTAFTVPMEAETSDCDCKTCWITSTDSDGGAILLLSGFEGPSVDLGGFGLAKGVKLDIAGVEFDTWLPVSNPPTTVSSDKLQAGRSGRELLRDDLSSRRGVDVLSGELSIGLVMCRSTTSWLWLGGTDFSEITDFCDLVGDGEFLV